MNILYENDLFTNNLFENKRVAIVGPAGYMKDFYDECLIDSYDLVIRFIGSLKDLSQNKEHTGSKTDIVATSLSSGVSDVELINWEDSGRVILCPFYIEYFDKIERGLQSLKEHSDKNNLNINLLLRTESAFRILWKQVNSGPTTGTAVIDYVLNCNVREIYITGFTFNHFKSDCIYMPGYSGCGIRPDDGYFWHYPLADEYYCNKLIREDNRIKVDNYIKNNILLNDDEFKRIQAELIENPKGHLYF